MIPIDLDYLGMITDFRRWGWVDSKVESVCGFSQGYINQVWRGNISEMGFKKGARFYNLWESERVQYLQTRTESVTS